MVKNEKGSDVIMALLRSVLDKDVSVRISGKRFIIPKEVPLEVDDDLGRKIVELFGDLVELVEDVGSNVVEDVVVPAMETAAEVIVTEIVDGGNGGGDD